MLLLLRDVASAVGPAPPTPPPLFLPAWLSSVRPGLVGGLGGGHLPGLNSHVHSTRGEVWLRGSGRRAASAMGVAAGGQVSAGRFVRARRGGCGGLGRRRRGGRGC